MGFLIKRSVCNHLSTAIPIFLWCCFFDYHYIYHKRHGTQISLPLLIYFRWNLCSNFPSHINQARYSMRCCKPSVSGFCLRWWLAGKSEQNQFWVRGGLFIGTHLRLSASQTTDSWAAGSSCPGGQRGDRVHALAYQPSSEGVCLSTALPCPFYLWKKNETILGKLTMKKNKELIK